MFGQSLLSAFGSAACTTDTDQLFATDVQTTSVATYQFNNATTSIPSNTYPGAASSITYATGKFGDAAVFNGSSSVVDISSSAGYPGSSVYTVSMWLNINDVTAYQGFFVNVSSPNIVNQFAAVLNSGRIDLWAVHTSGNTTIDAIETTPQTPFVNNTWYNVVIIADRSLANKAKVFVNNTENTYNYRPNIAGTTAYSTARIGLADNNYFGGLIDQVRIFNSSLPQAAVTALYNETTTTAQSASVDYQLVNPNSIAYYKMSSAADQLNNYNGTATNVNFNTEGKFGFAGAFNGSSSRITLSNTAFALTTYSVSLWVYSSDYSTSGTTLYDGGLDVSGTWGGLAVGFSANKIYYYGGDVAGAGGSGFYSQTGTTTITNSTWYNVTLIVNGTSITGYINGIQDTGLSRTLGANIIYKGTPGFHLGVRSGSFGSYGYLNGKIDQVRIYNAALSAANVTALYNEIECPAVAVTNAFNTVLYTGNGGTQAVTGVGFKPDFSWVKNRNTAGNSHELADVVRGVNNTLNSNSTGGEYNNSTYQFNSFDTDGITVTDDAAGNYAVNGNNETYVAWNWKAGGTAVSNTDGTITSQVSANVDAGFSVVSYTGNSTSGATVGHGITSPDLVIIKCTSTSSTNWIVYAAPLGNSKYLTLNLNNSVDTYSNWFYSNATTFTLNQTFGNANTSGRDYIAYCFKSIPGYSQIGSYIGTGVTGNAQYIGFEPAFLLVKRTSSTSDWYMIDNKRNPSNPRNSWLNANSNVAEYTPSHGVDFSSNGFSFISTDLNGTGQSWIFLAIA